MAAASSLYSSHESQDSDDELSPPLFVRIQTVDLHHLDFQSNTGNKAKFRNMTFVEVTNLFLFVGTVSGTVYVFSRDTLKFLFIIPFKGGKVCNISCSQDESDIAVGSIRGKVSIYRISPTVHYMQSSAAVPMIDIFRDIYDVPHHVGAEITEMQWSPNGKYLFVGDSQGIVSQMDVASLDEFPRPVPSRVILKLQSRVLQIDNSFPYLAVCTLSAVFLCDLEKEDFTRVQATKNKDLRSTGISFMILPEKSSLQDLSREGSIPSAKLVLFIGEASTGTIHCCNMEGSVQRSQKVEISKNVSKLPMPIFDPMKQTDAVSPEENGSHGLVDEEVHISLGKMLTTDDGMIVSVSTDKIFAFDPYTLNVIAWNEDLKRINNFKVISNYVFFWAGNKMEVLAFTQFRSYAEQLFRAKLLGVLKNWIGHTTYSLGWRSRFNEQLPESMSTDSLEEVNNESSELQRSQLEDAKRKVVLNCRKMLYSNADDEKEFTKFVTENLPFSFNLVSAATASVQDEEESLANVDGVSSIQETIIQKNVRQFSSQVQSLLLAPVQLQEQFSRSSSSESYSTTGRNRVSSTLSQVMMKSGQNDQFSSKTFTELWKALVEFYENIECTLPCLDYKKSDMTLSHVINATQTFLGQPKLTSLSHELSEIPEASIFEDITILLISLVYSEQNQRSKSATFRENSIFANSTSFSLCFTKFSQCPPVMKWFRDMGTSSELIFYDSLLTDVLLLLFPLIRLKRNEYGEIDRPLLVICLESTGIYEKLPSYFMTWLFLCKFLSEPKQVPYSPLLRSLLNDKLFENLAEEMFCTIYRDFRISTFDNAAQFIHHFVSTLVLLSKSNEYGHPRNVSMLLLNCFPLTKWAREDIITKIIGACHLNPMLLRLYMKACLEDGHSLKLCACGIQAGYGSMEGKVPSYQRAIEEAIIKLLLEEYFKSSSLEEEDGEVDEDDRGNGNVEKRRTEDVVHMFAMRRGLLEPYFRSPLPDEFLSDDLQAELIIRSGSCGSLKHYQCNERNMSLILRCYQYHFISSNASNNNEIIKSKFSSQKTGSNLKNGEDKVCFNDDRIKAKVNISGSGDIKLNEKSEKRTFGRCSKCSHPLQGYMKGFKPISRDCLGMWALKQVGSVERFIELVQNCRLNVKGTFSSKFYRAVAVFHERLHKSYDSVRHEDVDLFNESSILSCSIFHEK